MNYPSISGYEITGVLGEGGMGRVYKAQQLSLNRTVALKILPDTLAHNESYIRRFRQEAMAAAHIKHAGIVQVYDAGEDEGVYYFVMEYIDGETTGQRVRRKNRLDEKSALLIGEAVAVALEYAWDKASLVHRDIKPDNILIDADGTVKVTDLGLAKLLSLTSSPITISKMTVGTPYYCAPEQAKGEQDVDCRADIYALGATLYHFVTGKPPFSETSGVAAMVRNVTDYLPDPTDCNSEVSESFAWLLEKMMVKDRNRRYQNWHKFLDDLDMALANRLSLVSELAPNLSTILRAEKRSGQNGEKSWRSSGFKRKLRSSGKSGSSASSPQFKIFLAIAGIFTLVLYIIWFYMRTSGN